MPWSKGALLTADPLLCLNCLRKQKGSRRCWPCSFDGRSGSCSSLLVGRVQQVLHVQDDWHWLDRRQTGGDCCSNLRWRGSTAECDVSVSRLPGLETFANFLIVSVSVSENLVSEKKSRYRYRKIWSRKKSLGFGIGKFGLVRKVSVSVSKNLVSEKKLQRKSGQK